MPANGSRGSQKTVKLQALQQVSTASSYVSTGDIERCFRTRGSERMSLAPFEPCQQCTCFLYRNSTWDFTLKRSSAKNTSIINLPTKEQMYVETDQGHFPVLQSSQALAWVRHLPKKYSITEMSREVGQGLFSTLFSSPPSHILFFLLLPKDWELQTAQLTGGTKRLCRQRLP